MQNISQNAPALYSKEWFYAHAANTIIQTEDDPKQVMRQVVLGCHQFQEQDLIVGYLIGAMTFCAAQGNLKTADTIKNLLMQFDA